MDPPLRHSHWGGNTLKAVNYIDIKDKWQKEHGTTMQSNKPGPRLRSSRHSSKCVGALEERPADRLKETPRWIVSSSDLRRNLSDCAEKPRIAERHRRPLHSTFAITVEAGAGLCRHLAAFSGLCCGLPRRGPLTTTAPSMRYNTGEINGKNALRGFVLFHAITALEYQLGQQKWIFSRSGDPKNIRSGPERGDSVGRRRPSPS
ncbi:hypothetical protein LX36DRAFT_650575 [Colletotrichum falcatum]|nr:hypothetical protein LX36DRAFT_650575 [Colletotrichum falcatum]